MSTPLPPQSTPGSGLGVGTFLLVVAFLVAAIPIILVFIRYNTRRRLWSDYKHAIWLSENVLPIIQKDDAAQDAQGHCENASAELSKSILRCILSIIIAQAALDCDPSWRRSARVRAALSEAEQDAKDLNSLSIAVYQSRLDRESQQTADRDHDHTVLTHGGSPAGYAFGEKLC